MEVVRHWRLGEFRKNPSVKNCPGDCEKKILSINNTCGSKECNEIFLAKNVNKKGTV